MRSETHSWPMDARPRDPSDAHLIEAARGGDRDAFDRLIARHSPALDRFLQRRAGAAAEDVRQDTLLAAWTHLDRFGHRATFKTWLFSIALNKCRDQSRTRPVSELREDWADPDASFERLEMRCDVRRALGKMDPEQRDLLALYYEEELTLKEIAELLGRNLNTIKYQFYRAHDEFAKRMGDQR